LGEWGGEGLLGLVSALWAETDPVLGMLHFESIREWTSSESNCAKCIVPSTQPFRNWLQIVYGFSLFFEMHPSKMVL
jgi:hypothetical protein